jgi:protein TonB
MPYAVLCQLLLDEEGKVISYKLVNSSGNELFDRSALKALASVDRLRPPPQDMSRTIVVKFYPPT